MHETPQKPIFFDETHRRWGVFTAFLVSLSIILAISAIAFAVTVFVCPQSSIALTKADDLFNGKSLSVAENRKTPAPLDKAPLDPSKIAAKYVLKRNAAVEQAKNTLKATIRREATPMPIPASAIAPGHVAGPVRIGFYLNTDKDSYASLKNHLAQTTHLMPTWLHLKPSGTAAVIDQQFSSVKGSVVAGHVGTTQDDNALQLARQYGIAILPIFQNCTNGDFNEDSLHTLLSDPAAQQRVIAQLLSYIQKQHYQGINIDLETSRAEDRDGMTQFMTKLAEAFHPAGLLVTQDLQTDSSAYDLRNLSKLNDFVIPMIYDQHSTGSDSGPVAGEDWFKQQLVHFLSEIPASKVVLGLGNYGYDWAQGNPNADDLTFQQAVQIAQESQDGQDGVIRIDPQSRNPYFTYDDDSHGQGSKEISHKVWLLDATTVYNEMRIAAPYHVLGAALWRLGSEDPSLWSFFGKDTAGGLSSFDVSKLDAVNYNYFDVGFEGEGDILDVVTYPRAGSRTIMHDSRSGEITDENFLTYPTQYVIRRTGLVDQKSGENTSKAIALTFDDGPDPRWTPQILNILNRYHVPATFFVVGQNAQSHPGLVQREWNEGMDIGNHSFTHPEMDHVSTLRTKLELDATQRVIEAITGHRTTLFRAPNRADSEPSSYADFEPILNGDQLGYLFIGEKIDPTDWQPGITAAQIIRYVLNNAQDGNCVLLHDAGGDSRAETVKALPLIIEGLQRQGYRFVKVSQLVNRPRSQIFPEVSGSERWTVALDRFVFYTTYYLGNIFSTLFMATIFLGIGRILFMGGLALRQARQEARRIFPSGYQPPVTVIIAAYNEEKVINKTIATLLQSSYPDLDIIVVDDGSKDNTTEVVTQAYGANPRVAVISKPNGGKASALNLGIRQSRGEIIVALDADTMFLPDTISKMVRHFADPAIGAVSGNVKVGNRTNPLTIWQAVEYITSQNFDRRAFDLLNCITVVPGAVGAWRKDAVILAGLYSSQTLAEDTDLTFKVRKLGYRIVTDNSALAYTEAPDTLRDLAKQRFRWAFGTLQCLWKHRSSMLNPHLGAFGLVAMPSLWIYQIFFQAIAPIVDLNILWTLFYGRFITSISDHRDLTMLLGFWALFSTVDLVGALVAFHLDREDKRLVGWVLLQRFVYRQMMYYVIVKSLVVAIRGSVVGWGKLERKGTVQSPQTPAVGPKTASAASISPLSKMRKTVREGTSAEQDETLRN